MSKKVRNWRGNYKCQEKVDETERTRSGLAWEERVERKKKKTRQWWAGGVARQGWRSRENHEH